MGRSVSNGHPSHKNELDGAETTSRPILDNDSVNDSDGSNNKTAKLARDAISDLNSLARKNSRRAHLLKEQNTEPHRLKGALKNLKGSASTEYSV